MTRRSFESDSFDFGIRKKKPRWTRGKIVSLIAGLKTSFMNVGWNLRKLRGNHKSPNFEKLRLYPLLSEFSKN